MAALWHILQRHLAEADFLLEVWADCLEAPDCTLDDLAAGPEVRVTAQLDGLAVGGPSIVNALLAPVLERDALDTSLACAATLALFDVGTVDDCAQSLDALDASKPGDERWQGITRGLQLSDRAGLDDWIIEQLHHGGPGSRMAGLATAAAERGLDLGQTLARLLQSDEPWVVSAAAKLARNTDDPRSLALVGPLAGHDLPEVQHAALETGLVRGLHGAWESAVYWAFTEQPCAFRRDALAWVAVLGDSNCQRRLLSLLDDRGLARDVLWAASFGGSLDAVDAALALLTDDELGLLAGELVFAIAGAPLDDESLWITETSADDNAELPALDVDLDTNLDEDPEARLARPNPDALTAWWALKRKQFTESPRLLGGLPWSPERLIAALRFAPLRRRHTLALELLIRSNAALRVDTRSWTSWQLERLSTLDPALMTSRGGHKATATSA